MILGNIKGRIRKTYCIICSQAQLLQLRRLELRRLEQQHGTEQRCVMLQARCRSLEQDNCLHFLANFSQFFCTLKS